MQQAFPALRAEEGLLRPADGDVMHHFRQLQAAEGRFVQPILDPEAAAEAMYLQKMPDRWATPRSQERTSRMAVASWS